MKKIFLLFLFISVISYSGFCQTKNTHAKSESVSSHPEWIMQGDIYEVNVRQYTTEGTLNAFAKHLDRLKEMGVQTIWFMPINPISLVDRKGSLGSYYAVSDYTSVPLFTGVQSFKGMDFSLPANGFSTYEFNGRTLHTYNWPSASKGLSVAMFY